MFRSQYVVHEILKKPSTFLLNSNSLKNWIAIFELSENVSFCFQISVLFVTRKAMENRTRWLNIYTVLEFEFLYSRNPLNTFCLSLIHSRRERKHMETSENRNVFFPLSRLLLSGSRKINMLFYWLSGKKASMCVCPCCTRLINIWKLQFTSAACSYLSGAKLMKRLKLQFGFFHIRSAAQKSLIIVLITYQCGVCGLL